MKKNVLFSIDYSLNGDAIEDFAQTIGDLTVGNWLRALEKSDPIEHLRTIEETIHRYLPTEDDYYYPRYHYAI